MNLFNNNHIQMLIQNYKIPADFPKVGIILIAMQLQVYLLKSKNCQLRRKLFNQQFMKQHFGTVHQNQLKSEIQSWGYPDDGNGKYSQKLSYSDWFKLNSANRLQEMLRNSLSLSTTVVLALGLVKPNHAVAVGVSYIFCKLLYMLFNNRQKGQGKTMRKVSTFLSYATTVTGVGLFLWQCFRK